VDRKERLLFVEAKRIIRDEFPAKILRLTEMLNGEGLSMNRLTEVRDITANSTVAITDNTAVTAADDGGNPAKKRRLMQTIGVPSNNIIAQVTDEL